MWGIIVFAAVGAAIGIGSYIYGNNRRTKQIEAEQERIREKGERNLALMDLSWKQDVKSAFEGANSTLEGMAQSELMQAMGYNEAAIGAGSNEGAQVDAIANSGTRGSSSLQTAQMTSDIAAKELQLQQDSDRLQDKLTLESAVNTIAAYSTGGTQANIYSKQRSNYKKDIEAAVEGAAVALQGPHGGDQGGRHGHGGHFQARHQGPRLLQRGQHLCRRPAGQALCRGRHHRGHQRQHRIHEIEERDQCRSLRKKSDIPFRTGNCCARRSPTAPTPTSATAIPAKPTSAWSFWAIRSWAM